MLVLAIFVPHIRATALMPRLVDAGQWIIVLRPARSSDVSRHCELPTFMASHRKWSASSVFSLVSLSLFLCSVSL